MKILFLQEQPCIRTLKYAVGLKSQSSDVQLFFGYRGSTLSGYYGHGDELFDTWYRIMEDFERDIDSIVSKIQPVTINAASSRRSRRMEY